MLASHDPISDLASVRMGFLLVTAGTVLFWKIIIKLLIVAAVMLALFGLIVVVHVLP